VQSTATGRDALIGRSLEGRYRILDHIADGGMSRVYAAVDQRLDRLVAVKVMSTSLSADPAFSDRFAREARAAARLTHLNVVSVYDQGQERAPDGHHVFLVMELVEGRTLRELIRERGRLSPAEAISLMEPVLSALSAAHRSGLVHRDVKPENILLSDDGIVKVADFGLAHAVESDAEATRTGLMMGTVAYCSPEQLSEGRADPRSDVYSAGVVLFELLTGRPPYEGDTAMSIAWQHVHQRVPAPSSRLKPGARLPAEIDELVVAATDRDPGGRPPDAGSFLAEIADVRSELRLPVTPVPPRPRPAGRSWSERLRDGGAEHTTTVVRGAGRHDTTAMPDPAADRRTAPQRPDGRPPVRPETASDGALPPPVVIPPSAPSHRRRRALIAVLIVLILGGLAAWGGVWASHHFLRHVPKVTGESSTQARTDLEHAGYKVRFAPGRVYSETVKAGAVISSDPRAGTRLTTGQTVTLTLSLGERHFTVPDVGKLDPQAAKEQLAARGITNVDPTYAHANSLTVPANQVIATKPKAGTSITVHTSVVLIVSAGPPIVDVPNIAAGTSVDDAKSTLHKAGFKIDTSITQYDDTVPAGQVLSCNPTGKEAQGSTITCIVSKGPQFVTLPDIAVGTPLDQARQQLEGLGLQVKVDQIGNRADAVVYSMNPGAGQQVEVGSTVHLTAV
jgi:eukaryotic-like serine/threonine-protein kinase